MGAPGRDGNRRQDLWTETGDMRRTPATWGEAMADEVRQRLRDAMQTLRRMRMPAGSFPAGYSSAWPDVVQDFWEVYGQHGTRSEEHKSELQSLMRNSYDVFCLNKKKK